MLKVVLDSLDGLDAAVLPFYTEADGKFILQVEGVDNHPDVANLKNAYGRRGDSEKAAKAEAATLKAQIAELQKGAPDTAATQAQISALKEQLEAANAKTTELTGKLTGVTRDRALTEALQSAGITDPTFLKAALAMTSGMVKVDDNGGAYVETPMGPKLVQDFAKGWTAGEGKAFVTPPSGGGAKGNDQGGKAQTMTRADFNNLDPTSQHKAVMVDKITIL